VKLLFATRNKGKLVELRALVASLGVEVVGVAELEQALGRTLSEAPEDEPTFEGNAIQKARLACAETGLPVVADDSGLEVDALGGAPGVQSARYAGQHGDDAANNLKLLENLRGVLAERRTARFRCVVALATPEGQIEAAHGVCEGVILEVPRGTGGFGYDPLFYCPELDATFAEAGVGPKGGVSHRARALRSLEPALRSYFGVAKGGRSG
jgi:XTP/dITP diphosphohydrolase